MIGAQILALLFVLWMTYFSFLHFRRKEFSFWEYIFWQCIWLGLAVISLFPGTVNVILERLHIVRALDLLTIGGFVLLFGSTFRNYVIVRRVERRLEQVVRSKALE